MDLNEVFKKFVNSTARVLNVKVPARVPEVSLGDFGFDLNGRWFGVRREDNVVFVSRELVDAGLLRGVLAREAFRLFMPKCLEGVEEAGDLAWEFARLQLRGDEEKLWVSTWFKVSPKVFVKNIVYYAPFGFPIFEKLSGGRFLGEVFKIFRQLDVYRYDLSFEEYVEVLEEFMSNFPYVLDDFERGVLQVFLNNPGLSRQELAERVGRHVSKVSRVVSRLKSLYVLRSYPTVFLPKIGLRTFVFVFQPKFEYRDYILDVLYECPFLYSVLEAVDGNMPVITFFCAPYGFERYLGKFADRLRKLRFVNFAEWFLRIETYKHYSFRFYVPKVGWRIEWEAWALWFKKVLLEGEYYEVLGVEGPIFEDVKTERFDSVDLKILDFVWMNRVADVRSVREALKISMNNAVERLRDLKSRGIIVRRADASNIGLSEIVVFKAEMNDEVYRAFIAALDDLPLHFTSKLQGERGDVVLSIVFLPEGGGIWFAKVLKKYFGKPFRLWFGRYVSGITFKLPIDLYDYRRRKWKIPAEILSLK
ncbi:MAG: winged helix-turn-helix transcriptional regulator [Candidatus Baldrarchaeia archaeon]